MGLDILVTCCEAKQMGLEVKVTYSEVTVMGWRQQQHAGR